MFVLLELWCVSSQGLLQPHSLNADGKSSAQVAWLRHRKRELGKNNNYGVIKIPARYQECDGGGDGGVLGGGGINVSGLCPSVLALGREKNPRNFLVRPGPAWGTAMLILHRRFSPGFWGSLKPGQMLRTVLTLPTARNSSPDIVL